jgi:hypothetical protein
VRRWISKPDLAARVSQLDSIRAGLGDRVSVSHDPGLTYGGQLLGH